MDGSINSTQTTRQTGFSQTFLTHTHVQALRVFTFEAGRRRVKAVVTVDTARKVRGERGVQQLKPTIAFAAVWKQAAPWGRPRQGDRQKTKRRKETKEGLEVGFIGRARIGFQ